MSYLFKNSVCTQARLFMSSPLPCRNNLVKLFPGCYSVGNLSKVTLNHRQLAELNEVIPGVAVDVQQSHSFKKILFKKKTLLRHGMHKGEEAL